MHLHDVFSNDGGKKIKCGKESEEWPFESSIAIFSGLYTQTKINTYHIYSNRGQPQKEADSNISRNVRALPCGLNDPIFKNSLNMVFLDQIN